MQMTVKMHTMAAVAHKQLLRAVANINQLATAAATQRADADWHNFTEMGASMERITNRLFNKYMINQGEHQQGKGDKGKP